MEKFKEGLQKELVAWYITLILVLWALILYSIVNYLIHWDFFKKYYFEIVTFITVAWAIKSIIKKHFLI